MDITSLSPAMKLRESRRLLFDLNSEGGQLAVGDFISLDQAAKLYGIPRNVARDLFGILTREKILVNEGRAGHRVLRIPAPHDDKGLSIHFVLTLSYIDFLTRLLHELNSAFDVRGRSIRISFTNENDDGETDLVASCLSEGSLVVWIPSKRITSSNRLFSQPLSNLFIFDFHLDFSRELAVDNPPVFSLGRSAEGLGEQAVCLLFLTLANMMRRKPRYKLEEAIDQLPSPPFSRLFDNVFLLGDGADPSFVNFVSGYRKALLKQALPWDQRLVVKSVDPAVRDFDLHREHLGSTARF
ncbi:hypothetical protein K2X33_07930, partial [bacterium]|nr:hypothetical protein [bacterium]